MASELIQTEYAEIMQKSYIDYAMSVIVARALPDSARRTEAGPAPHAV